MELIIAEKPSVATEIAKVVGADTRGREYHSGNGYCVTWCFGHLLEMDVPEADAPWSLEQLPLLPQSFGMKPIKLKLREGERDRLTVIGELMERCSSIIVATDAGREGELIFRNIYKYFNCRKPFRRLWINSLTEKTIREGFGNLYEGHMFDTLAAAAREREIADWLVGVNATRLMTLLAGGSSGTVLSIGRVQTPTLCLICSRYEENARFRPEPFWFMEGTSTVDGVQFRWRSDERFTAKADAEEALQGLQMTGFLTVTEAGTERRSEAPPLLHDLASLQQEASSRYSLPLDVTASVAQSLYEKKLITYPRPGTRYISEDVFAGIPALLRQFENDAQYGTAIKGLLEGKLNRHCVNDTKLTDHHAFLVTGRGVNLESNEAAVYGLILRRMVEAFSPACVTDVTSVTMECSGHTFSTRGRRELRAGWRAVGRGDGTAEPELEEVDEVEMNAAPLPELKEGDIIRTDSAEIVEDKTKPKPLYTDGTLVAAMCGAGKFCSDRCLAKAIADSGLGTDATRAAILETLIKRGYVTRSRDCRLKPTRLGFAMYVTVKDRSIGNVELTAAWETSLEGIAQGQADAADFGKDIRNYTLSLIRDLKEGCRTDILRREAEAGAVPCPKCGTPLRFGDKNVFCRNHDCGFTLWRTVAGHRISDTETRRLVTEGRTGLIDGFKGKNGTFKAFLVRDTDGGTSFEFPEKVTLKCPGCGRSITVSEKGAFCRECGLSLWRTVAGKTLTDEQLKALSDKRRTSVLKGFKSKAGKSFDAALVLGSDGKVTFEFKDR